MFAIIRHAAHLNYPDHLTESGQNDTKLLANQLQPYTWTCIHTSPRLRTQETADILGRILHIPVVINPTLLEDSDHDRWLPPHDPGQTILVSHAPVIREIISAWARLFPSATYQPIGLAKGALLDPEQKQLIYL